MTLYIRPELKKAASHNQTRDLQDRESSSDESPATGANGAQATDRKGNEEE